MAFVIIQITRLGMTSSSICRHRKRFLFEPLVLKRMTPRLMMFYRPLKQHKNLLITGILVRPTTYPAKVMRTSNTQFFTRSSVRKTVRKTWTAQVRLSSIVHQGAMLVFFVLETMLTVFGWEIGTALKQSGKSGVRQDFAL